MRATWCERCLPVSFQEEVVGLPLQLSWTSGCCWQRRARREGGGCQMTGRVGVVGVLGQNVVAVVE